MCTRFMSLSQRNNETAWKATALATPTEKEDSSRRDERRRLEEGTEQAPFRQRGPCWLIIQGAIAGVGNERSTAACGPDLRSGDKTKRYFLHGRRLAADVGQTFPARRYLRLSCIVFWEGPTSTVPRRDEAAWLASLQVVGPAEGVILLSLAVHALDPCTAAGKNNLELACA